MEIHEQRQGAVTVVRPGGPVTGSDADQLRDRLVQVVGESLGRVVLDASRVSYLDSRGLEALVDISEEMSHTGSALKLCTVNETVRQVLELTGTARSFEHFEDATAAVRSFL